MTEKELANHFPSFEEALLSEILEKAEIRTIALYFALGAILNVGCFEASCAINFKQKQNDAHSDEKNIQARPDTQNH